MVLYELKHFDTARLQFEWCVCSSAGLCIAFIVTIFLEIVTVQI